MYQRQEDEVDTLKRQSLDRDNYRRQIMAVVNSDRYVVSTTIANIEPYLAALTEYQTSEELLHEKEHFYQAVLEGFTPLIGFYFFHTDYINFRVALQLFVLPTTEIPETMSDEKYYAALERVVRAVREPSYHDNRMLGEA